MSLVLSFVMSLILEAKCMCLNDLVCTPQLENAINKHNIRPSLIDSLKQCCEVEVQRAVRIKLFNQPLPSCTTPCVDDTHHVSILTWISVVLLLVSSLDYDKINLMTQRENK